MGAESRPIPSHSIETVVPSRPQAGIGRDRTGTPGPDGQPIALKDELFRNWLFQWRRGYYQDRRWVYRVLELYSTNLLLLVTITKRTYIQ